MKSPPCGSTSASRSPDAPLIGGSCRRAGTTPTMKSPPHGSEQAEYIPLLLHTILPSHTHSTLPRRARLMPKQGQETGFPSYVSLTSTILPSNILHTH